ncbi:hypothetical protein IAQ61_001541 [Plenodomus lingam]|uniref:Uncharacterized protein n=1 Tax=Leptosphaeria maculans (strain JN3 / isolate v23.1.3 / race Av1-4-5-6-7-8) TaxID=985895 RepID=E4ZYC8_LEPMJ|nr:hypothetical protein LEMA_P112920.1 [Plenodomus lingam JN3]KAH9879722.1 hypothetical protein IAQ61_001541 [Plenodomus lingam]CBX96373.1 hypothetical protein LEMA_P112920.1 [Plenodomus lingam JN3]
MGVGETITVINKSGKVVSSSKHIVNVFKEAKAAYRERKAEIQAERDAVARERKLAKGVEALRIQEDDTRSHYSRATHRSKSHRKSSHRERPSMERGYTDSFYANDSPRQSPRGSTHRFEQDLAGEGRDAHRKEIARRNSDMHVQQKTRSKSEAFVDMDLAYGDIPPPLPAQKYDDGELKEKASKITILLDEANCLQYSVTTMIENLQQNPEALAAVSLTLAEISAIVGKMGPGVLMTLKGSFPAVAALLLSPQFMIAGGVAVGVTIVALGGYKIIKKIQAQSNDPLQPMPMNAAPAGTAALPPRVDEVHDTHELEELEPQELSRVEMWRRGIADVAEYSAGTSVDGEFITPGASRQLIAAGVLDEDDMKSRRSTRSRRDKERDAESRAGRSHRAKSVVSEKSTRSHKTSRTGKTGETKRSKTVKEGASKKKEKEPSGLKMLFRSHTTHA